MSHSEKRAGEAAVVYVELLLVAASGAATALLGGLRTLTRQAARLTLERALFVATATKELSSGRPRTPRHEDFLDLTWEFEARTEAGGRERPVPAGQSGVEGLLGLVSPTRGRILIVVGAPGAGKSTLLRQTGLALAERAANTVRRPFPILLNLGEHTGSIVHGGAADLAAVATRSVWGGSRIFRWSSRWLVRGRCVVLVDGLDDVVDADDRAPVLSWLNRQIAAHPGNSWVLASRPVADPGAGLPAAATVLRVRALTAGQIERYVHRQFTASSERAVTPQNPLDDIHRLLDRLRTGPLRELASTPLALSVIVDAYARRESATPSATEIYREVWHELTERSWLLRSRAGGRSGRRNNRRIMRHLALAMMEEGRTFVSPAEAVRLIAGSLRPLPFTAEPGLLESMMHSGVLVEREPGVLSFAQLGMREFLAAEQILAEGLKRTVTEHVDDPAWHGTILFWAADTDASAVVEACLDLGTERALELARECAEVSDRVAPGLRQALARELALTAPRQGPRNLLPGTTPLTAYVERERAGAAHDRLAQATAGLPLSSLDIDAVLPHAGASGGPGRPQDDADAFLSAAVLAAALGRDQEAGRHRFRGLMALALRMRVQNRESARDLCLAALSCLDRQARHRAEAARAIAVYLGTGREDPAQDYGDADVATYQALRRHLHAHGGGPAAFEVLVPLLATSEDAAGLIHDWLRRDPYAGQHAARYLATGPLGPEPYSPGLAADAWSARVDGWRRARRALTHGLAGLARIDLDRESLRDARERLAGPGERAPAHLAADLEGMRRALAALDDSLDDWRFDEKDAALRTAERIAGELRASVGGAPTALGVELVEPAALRVETLARTARRHLARTMPPQPYVAPALPSARLRDGTVTLQLRVGNTEGRAPVESGRLDITAASAFLRPATQRVDLPAAVRGGTSATVLVRLDLGDDHRDAASVEVVVALRHLPRGHDTSAVEEQRLTVPVDRDFAPIDPNPFSDGALGRPVDDPDMFYGRDELIDRVRARLAATSPGVGVAIFGQKRTGKSSIRLQLTRMLTEQDGLPVVDVHNLAELKPPRSEDADRQLLGALLWRILDGADRTLRAGPRLLPPGFDRQALIASPDPVFDCGDLFGRHREACPQSPPWVVFIDEFQYLDQWIRDDLLSPSFMRAFKAIIERRLFHLVLVGQSDMERLIEADPNAFGVFGVERVTYLEATGARSLAEEPVPLPAGPARGTSRYEGRAVEEIIRLSGGNPFYIQRLCSALVDHMNTERASRVTEADVAQVAQRLVGTLRAGDFDNLESPGTADAAWTSQDVRAVLAAVANASHGGPATRRDIDRHHTGTLPRELLDDLVARQIVLRERDGYRIVVGLYEAWLRRYFGSPERTQ